MEEQTLQIMINLCWLDINASYSHSSLALPAIEANDTTGAINWRCVSGTTKSSIDDILSELLSQPVDLLCATAWLFTHDYLLDLLKRFHQLSPDTIISLGGPEFLGDNYEYLKRHSFIRLVHKGDGEQTFFQWISIMDQPARWHTVPGFCYIDEEDRYHDNGVASVSSFPQLRPPSHSSFFPFHKPFVQFETSRGCYNTCAFCVSGGDNRIQSLSLEQIAEQLDLFVSRGIREIRLLDRTFNSSSQRAIDMLTLFESYHGRLSFHLEIHPALLTDALRSRIESLPVGLLHLEAGVQSLNEEVIRLVERKGSVVKTLEGLRFLCGLETMETHVDLIAGLPQYTLAELFDDTCTLICLQAAEIQIELLKLLPGTRLRNNARSLGIQFNPNPPYEVLSTHHISPDELRKATRLSRIVDLFYNDSTFQSLFGQMVNNESSDFLPRLVDEAVAQSWFENPAPKERSGELLTQYIHDNYPHYLFEAQRIWLMAGFSLYRLPYCDVKSYKKELPAEVSTLYGQYYVSQRLYRFINGEGRTVFVGFDRSVDQNRPQYIGLI